MRGGSSRGWLLLLALFVLGRGRGGGGGGRIPPMPGPVPPIPPRGVRFVKGARYVLTLDFEGQQQMTEDQARANVERVVGDRLDMDQIQMQAGWPFSVTARALVSRTIRLPLHFQPPDVVYLVDARQSSPIS